MSGLGGLYNVPGTQEELDTWAFTHQAHHRDINRRIFELTGVALPEYVLDPMDLHDKTWLRQHQTMHENQDAILGISGFNLLNVELADPEQLAGFVFLNANEHVQASDILGIG